MDMRQSLCRFAFAIGMLVLWSSAGLAQEKTKFPEDHGGFIVELTQLMKKYPKAAERFSLRDSSKDPGKPQAAHHMCCEWDCPWSPPSSNLVGCTCREQCPK
jgi:hypothetical protein